MVSLTLKYIKPNNFFQENLLQEQKSVLSQLHKERQAVTEERTKVSVAQQVQREEMEDIGLKLSQVMIDKSSEIVSKGKRPAEVVMK